MLNHSIIKKLAMAGNGWLVCPVAGCPSTLRPMSVRSWWNHIHRAHLNPEPVYRCPFLPCIVESRDPGMRVHVRSHAQ